MMETFVNYPNLDFLSHISAINFALNFNVSNVFLKEKEPASARFET